VAGQRGYLMTFPCLLTHQFHFKIVSSLYHDFYATLHHFASSLSLSSFIGVICVASIIVYSVTQSQCHNNQSVSHDLLENHGLTFLNSSNFKLPLFFLFYFVCFLHLLLSFLDDA